MRTNRDTGRPDGCAVVTFETAAELEKSMEAEGVEMAKRPVHLRVFEDYGGQDKGGRGGRGGGDRDRDNSYNNRGGRGDRDGGRGDRRDGGRGDRRDNRGGRDEGEDQWARRSKPVAEVTAAAAKMSVSAEPAARPKLQLAPRTVPLETAGAPVAVSSIFGEGKARVEAAAAPGGANLSAGPPATEKPTGKPTGKSERTEREGMKGPPAEKGDKSTRKEGGRDKDGNREGRDRKKREGAPVTVFNKAMKDSTRPPRKEREAGGNKSTKVDKGEKSEKEKPAAKPAAAKPVTAKPTASVVKSSNAFGALDDDEDDE